MAKSDELTDKLQEIEVEIHEAAGRRDAVRLRELQRRQEIIQNQLLQVQPGEQPGRMMGRLRETGPLWVVLTFFGTVLFGRLAVAPLADSPFEHYTTLARVLGWAGIFVCVVIGLLALVLDPLRGLSRRLSRAIKMGVTFVRENIILTASASLTIVLFLVLGTSLGQPSAAAIGLALALANIGITIGILRILGPRLASEGSGHLTRHTELLGQAVWHDGSYFLLTTDGKYRLPDEATAKFLGAGRTVLPDVTLEELDQFPTITNLQSVTKAGLVKRRDSGDHFFIFEGDDRRKYKAHIASMSMPVDYRPDLNVSEAQVWPPHELQSCTTLR